MADTKKRWLEEGHICLCNLFLDGASIIKIQIIIKFPPFIKRLLQVTNYNQLSKSKY